MQLLSCVYTCTQSTSQLHRMVLVVVLCVLLYHSVYCVQFEHFPVVSDMQYRYGTHRGQGVGVGKGVGGIKNGDVQDLIDFVSDHSDQDSEDGREQGVRQRVKQTQGIFHSDQGRQSNMIKGNRKGDRKERDDNEGRKKIKHQFERRKVTKHVAGQTTGRRMRITAKPKSLKMQKVKASGSERPSMGVREGGELDKHQQKGENRQDETTNIKKETPQIKKVKKIRKALQGLSFGTKTTSLSLNDIFGLPSNIVEVMAPPPRTTSTSMRVKRRKMRPNKVNRNKSTKDEPVKTTLKPLNRALQNNNLAVKRSEQQKRQFKNSPSSLLGNIMHRNILTQA